MSDPQAESNKAADPLEQWRELRDAYMDAWAKATGETVNSEAYAQASGAMLETYLTASSPFRDAQKKLMVSALEQLNMPSRADFVSLAERLANLELLLDDMAAKLSQIHQLATSPPSAIGAIACRPRPKPNHCIRCAQGRSQSSAACRPRPNQKRSPRPPGKPAKLQKRDPNKLMSILPGCPHTVHGHAG